MRLIAAIILMLSLAVLAAGCGASGSRTEETPTPTAMQTQAPSATPVKTAIPVNRVRFLEAFSIGHPQQAGEGTHAFVLNNSEEEAALLDGFDAVKQAISANYKTESVILVTFTANVITQEEEYSLKSADLTAGRGGHIEILYTVTPDRPYSQAGCSYYAIIVIPKTDIPASGITVEIINQTQAPSSTPVKTAIPVKRVRFLEAFSIGHPQQAGEGTHAFVLNSSDEEAALLDGFDAVSEAISADYENETVLLVTFTANVITQEEEYSLKSAELTAGRGGHIEILYTVTPDRGYSEAICPYYAIIVIPKTDIPASGITVEIING